MRKFLFLLVALLMAHLMIASPLAYKWVHDTHCRNFRVVEDGVLYRSGQLTLPCLEQVCSKFGIRTIICLREGNDPMDQREEAWVKAKGFKHVRIPPRNWSADETGKIPAEASVETFHAVMDDPGNYPVLVHCFAGIHRTGTMCALYRMDYQGWSGPEAMHEMRTMGYALLDDHEDIRGFLTNYLPQRTAQRKNLPIQQVSRQIDAHP